MKKILLAIVALTLTTNLLASGSHIQILAGTSQVENTDSTFAFGTGYDFVKTTKSGLEIGLGLDVLYSNNKDYNTNISGDLSFLFGYTKNNFAIRTGVGYGIGTIENEYTQSGMVFSAGGEYDLTSKMGLGLKYKYQSFEIEILSSTEPATTKNLLFYFYFKR